MLGGGPWVPPTSSETPYLQEGSFRPWPHGSEAAGTCCLPSLGLSVPFVPVMGLLAQRSDIKCLAWDRWGPPATDRVAPAQPMVLLLLWPLTCGELLRAFCLPIWGLPVPAEPGPRTRLACV